MKSKDEIKKPIIYLSSITYSEDKAVEELEQAIKALEENPFIERYFTPYLADSYTQGKPKQLVTEQEVGKMAYLNGFNLEEADVVISLNYGMPATELGYALARDKTVVTYNPTGSMDIPIIEANVDKKIEVISELEVLNFIKLLN